MRKPTFVLAFVLMSCIATASAATWNIFWRNTNEALFFFDADTVEKSGNTVTLWVKAVRKWQGDLDGSWAHAERWRFNCSARTIQTLSSSSYNNSGDFIKSNNKPSAPSLVPPDSIGETVLKIACEPNFPRDTTGSSYFMIDPNDVFKARDIWLQHESSQVDTAPK